MHGSTGDSGGGIYDALIGSTGLKGLVRNTQIACLKLVPATIDLIGAEIELVDMEDRETRLKDALREVSGIFDYIFIDCPPSLSLLSINALAASDSVLIPIQCEYYALEGISKIIKTLELVRGGINPNLSIEGVLLTMFDARNNLSHQVADEIRGHLGDKTYTTVIPRNVRLSESPSFGKPVMLYAPHSSGALSYEALGREFLRRRARSESESDNRKNLLETIVY
jgi:chromosome partitioning protein